MRRIFLCVIVCLAAALAASAATAADIKVMISAGFFNVYAQLGPAFEKSTGHKLVTTRGPSLGDSPEAIPTRLARGEEADVLIMDGHGADILDARGMTRPGSRMPLAESFIGMVVRAGQPKPDISTVEAMRKAPRREIHRLFGQFERHLSVDRRVQEARRRRRDRRQVAQGARTAFGGAGGGRRRPRRGGGRFPAGRRADSRAGRRFCRHSAVRHSTADLFRRRAAEEFAAPRCGGGAAAFPVLRRGGKRHHEGRTEAAGAVIAGDAHASVRKRGLVARRIASGGTAGPIGRSAHASQAFHRPSALPPDE